MFTYEIVDDNEVKILRDGKWVDTLYLDSLIENWIDDNEDTLKGLSEEVEE